MASNERERERKWMMQRLKRDVWLPCCSTQVLFLTKKKLIYRCFRKIRFDQYIFINENSSVFWFLVNQSDSMILDSFFSSFLFSTRSYRISNVNFKLSQTKTGWLIENLFQWLEWLNWSLRLQCSPCRVFMNKDPFWQTSLIWVLQGSHTFFFRSSILNVLAENL